MMGESIEAKTITISLKVAMTSAIFIVATVAVAMSWAITMQVKVERTILDIERLTKHDVVTDLAVGQITTGNAVLVSKLEDIINSQRRIEATISGQPVQYPPPAKK